MTDVTVKLNDDTIVVLAVEANNKSITLSAYVQQLVDEHVKSILKQQLNSLNKKEATKQAKVLEVEDIDDVIQPDGDEGDVVFEYGLRLFVRLQGFVCRKFNQ